MEGLDLRGMALGADRYVKESPGSPLLAYVLEKCPRVKRLLLQVGCTFPVVHMRDVASVSMRLSTHDNQSIIHQPCVMFSRAPGTATFAGARAAWRRPSWPAP